MIGKRVEPVFFEGGGWQRLQPGEYAKVRGQWHACTPNGQPANLTGHTVTEHMDRTITVAPSIRVFTPGVTLFHGYLEAGVWRACPDSPP